jgi:hypothetical protein
VCELIRDDFVLEDAWATTHLTLEDILSHRSGLSGHDRAFGRPPGDGIEHDKPRAVLKEIVRSIRHIPMTAEPRTTYQYSNIMYQVASYIVETLTGQWLGRFLHDRIWQPLGMDSTYFMTKDAEKAQEDLATGYWYDEQKKDYCEINDRFDMDGTSGAGSNISNVEDYIKWAEAVISKSDVLPKTAWDELLKPRTVSVERVPGAGPDLYALGWHSGMYKGHQYYEHSGGLDAFGSDLLIFPGLKYASVMMGNVAGSSNFAIQALMWHLVDEKLGISSEERCDWNTKNKKYIEGGIEEAATAKEYFYPNLPEPIQPCSLPLKAYAGSYHHPGYQTLKIYIDANAERALEERAGNPVLFRADRTEVTIPEHMAFEHINKDYFLIRSSWFGDFAAWFPDVNPAEFRLGADGKVSEIGIRWEPRLGDRKIWLKKVD